MQSGAICLINGADLSWNRLAQSVCLDAGRWRLHRTRVLRGVLLMLLLVVLMPPVPGFIGSVRYRLDHHIIILIHLLAIFEQRYRRTRITWTCGAFNLNLDKHINTENDKWPDCLQIVGAELAQSVPMGPIRRHAATPNGASDRPNQLIGLKEDIAVIEWAIIESLRQSKLYLVIKCIPNQYRSDYWPLWTRMANYRVIVTNAHSLAHMLTTALAHCAVVSLKFRAHTQWAWLHSSNAFYILIDKLCQNNASTRITAVNQLNKLNSDSTPLLWVFMNCSFLA